MGPTEDLSQVYLSPCIDRVQNKGGKGEFMVNRKIVLMIAPVLMVLLSQCKPVKDSSSKRRPVISEGSGIENVGTPMTGTIVGNKFNFVRGFAYVDPSRPDGIEIRLYDKNGPASCHVSDGSVWQGLGSGAYGYVWISIPRKTAITNFPYRSTSASQVRVGHEDERGAGGSGQADEADLEITSITDTQIVGSLTVKKNQFTPAQIAGSFVVQFCENSQN